MLREPNAYELDVAECEWERQKAIRGGSVPAGNYFHLPFSFEQWTYLLCVRFVRGVKKKMVCT